MGKMRSEQEMFNLILAVARLDDSIKAVYLNGSRANDKIKKDQYQDYDIVYVVDDTLKYINNKSFISIFGTPLIIQEPDLMDKNSGLDIDFNIKYTWLMLFNDGNRIDLTIVNEKYALEYFMEDHVYKILLDKNNILPTDFKYSTDKHIIKKPSIEEYHNSCNEFWWCLNNVAKGINRDELSYVMEMYNHFVRKQLHIMLNWMIGVNNNFMVSVGKMGKYYKDYLSEELYNLYKMTYPTANYPDIWDAVFRMAGLFRLAAKEVAKKLNYNYNASEDDGMMEYLNKMKDHEYSL